MIYFHLGIEPNNDVAEHSYVENARKFKDVCQTKKNIHESDEKIAVLNNV